MRIALKVVIALVLVGIALTAASQARAPAEKTPNTTKLGVKTPTQILDDNRDSVGIIVAAGDTSMKLGTTSSCIHRDS